LLNIVYLPAAIVFCRGALWPFVAML